MKASRFFFIIALCTAMILINAAPVFAVSGIPGSPDFGIGVVNNQGDTAQSSSQPFTWVKVNVAWSSAAPTSKKPVNLDFAENLNNVQKSGKTALLISLTNPPAWAISTKGPGHKQTIEMIDALLAAFPGVTAIELFPEANTTAGWGSSPDPHAYAKLFLAIQSHLNQIHSSVLLVAGGLKPVAASSANEMNDLEFLQQLYDTGIAASMPVLSIHLQNLSGEPWQNPQENSATVLRHYEQIRQIMLANHHQSGILWVTSLEASINPNSGKVISSSLSSADWLQQAVAQMQSQLFLSLVILPEN